MKPGRLWGWGRQISRGGARGSAPRYPRLGAVGIKTSRRHLACRACRGRLCKSPSPTAHPTVFICHRLQLIWGFSFLLTFFLVSFLIVSFPSN